MRNFYLIFSFSFIFSSVLKAEEQENFVTIGDSISIGSFSKFTLNLNLLNPPQMLEEGVLTGLMRLPFINKLEFSWSSGTQIPSVYKYFKSKNQSLGFKNYAFGSAHTQHVRTQVEKAFEELGSSISTVTIMIGPNNVCDESTDLNDPVLAGKHLEETMSNLLVSTKAKIILTDVANFDQLHKIQNNKGFYGLKCTTIWKQVWGRFCPRLINRILSGDPSDLEWLNEERIKFDREWKRIADNLNTRFPGRVLYTPIFENQKIEARLVSADCFHPNKLGQEKIANSVIEYLNKN